MKVSALPLPEGEEAVRRPNTVEEVAAVIREAGERGWAVIPRGGGTMLDLGTPPRAADVLLDLTGLDALVEYEPADLVVTVQAGMRLAALQRRLAEHGQCLALDPPLPEQATIGGVIASNASGPLRLRYGTVRDMLLGIRIVGADGTITKAGGRVVKNVTGYDLGKLHTGALGTLGVIVEASFKLAPLPRVERTVLAHFTGLDEAYAAARALHAAALPLRACELLSPATVGAIALPSPAAAGEDSWLLAVWVGGGESAVGRQVGDVVGACADAATTSTVEGEEQRAFWRTVEDYGRDGVPDTIVKLSVKPSLMGELLRLLPAEAPVVAHVLSGVAYLFQAPAPELRTMVERLGGYMVLEHAPLAMKNGDSVWGPPGPDLEIMQRIKQQFDPQGTLNPGRYVGGL